MSLLLSRNEGLIEIDLCVILLYSEKKGNNYEFYFYLPPVPSYLLEFL